MPARRPKTPRTRDQIVAFDAKTDGGKERLLAELARREADVEKRVGKVESGLATVETDFAALEEEVDEIITSGPVPGSRLISTTGGITGGGDLTADRTLSILDNGVTLAKLADIATATFIGRSTAGTGDPEALTATLATALLDTFTSALKGLVPASGGGTDSFLRADGSWAVPSTIIAGLFGTGNDGVQDFDGTTAVLGVTPASDTIGDVTVNAYTQDRDWYLEDGSTIADGVAILGDGYRLFLNGELVGPSSGMAYVGNWGPNGGDGTSTTAGAAGSARSAHLLAGCAQGGTGGNTSTGVSTAGAATSNCPREFSSSGGGGGTGAGGNGEDGVSGSGGGGGANKDGSGGSGAGSCTAVSSSTVGDIDNIIQALQQLLFASTTRFSGGSGGGGGRGQQNSPTGGGGGGGAGCGGAVVAIEKVTGNVTLIARGGDGGDGWGSAGGGGGGGGGLLTVVYGAGSAPTTDVSGGTGGGSLGGTGGAGGDGGPGVAKVFRF